MLNAHVQTAGDRSGYVFVDIWQLLCHDLDSREIILKCLCVSQLPDDCFNPAISAGLCCTSLGIYVLLFSYMFQRASR